MGIDPQIGRTNWEIQVFDQKHTETSIGSPVISRDLVLGTCGWLGYATHTVAVRPYAPVSATRPNSNPGAEAGGSGGGPVEVYRVDRGAPLTTTPLVVDGLLFLWADEGIVTCADAASGERYWTRRVGGTYYGSPVASGGAVYCASRDGEMIVLAVGKEYRLLGRNPLLEGSHSTPAISNGRMYIRTFTHLISLGGAGE
jgi:outer membrane protein assembly factor BamB